MTDKPSATILNVDDDDAARYATTRVLRAAGYEVIEAANGRDTLRLAKRNPDLVVLDVNLPDIDGFEVCRRIKSDPTTSMIPVVHLSATYQDENSKVTGLESGADGYLTHPVEPKVLVAYVRALLRTREAEAHVTAAARQWGVTFDAMNDDVCLVDKKQKILRCNAAMTKLLRKPHSEIIGSHCWEVVHGTTAPVDECPFRHMMENGTREEFVFWKGDRCLHHAVDPVIDEAGRVNGAVQIFSDITERKRAEEALKKAHNELEQRVEERTAELRRLSSRLIDIQETERKRIARELHDSIGQFLAATKFGLEDAINKLPENAAKESVESLKALIPLILETSDEIRKIHTDLRPGLLDDLGIIATISWFCRESERLYSGLRIKKQIDIEEEAIPDSLKIVIFRILQEALHNVVKHAKASLVRVALTKAGDQINLFLEDNGHGFDMDRALSLKGLEKGFGLISMKERAELSGGSLAIESAPGAGTTIRAFWPYHSTKSTL
jgi:PAS domain S-box-containing protein